MTHKELALNLDDLGNSSDDSNDSFYQSALNNREPTSYVQKPPKHPVLSNIPEESNAASTSKKVENEKFEKPITSGSTVKFNANQNKTVDNDAGIIDKSGFIPSKSNSRTRSRFFEDLFPEVNHENKSENFADDDLFGLNRSKTDKASYEQKFATPDTIPLSESQNLGNESDTARKSNKSMLNAPKDISEITADLFGSNIPKTGIIATANYEHRFSTPDTILSSRGENRSDQPEDDRRSKGKNYATRRTDISGKGDWLGLDSIPNRKKETETLEGEIPRANVGDIPTENEPWKKVLTNETKTSIELLSSHDAIPPINFFTNSQPHINDIASEISIQDGLGKQRLTELKEISNSLGPEIHRISTSSSNKRVQVGNLSENNNYIQGNSRSNSQTRLELNVSQAQSDENILPQDQNVPAINTRAKSKHTGPRNKKKSKSAQKVNKKSKSERNTAQYNSESALDSNITQTCSESEEQNEPEYSLAERQTLNQHISRSRKESELNKWYIIEKLLKNNPEQILAQCPKYLEMESLVKVLQLEKERLEKLVKAITESTDNEVEEFKITQQKVMDFQKNYQHQLEERLEMETREIKKSFENKMNALQTEAELQRNKHEEEISELKKIYEEKVKTMQSTHMQTIEMFKEQYSLLLKSVRGIGVSDNSVPENNSNSAMTQQIMEKWNTEQQKRETKLAMREEKLTQDIEQFEIMQQNYKHAKEQIMGTIRELEIKLEATIKESNDQTLKIRSEISRINSCQKYLEYENERMMNKFKREEERLKRLKLSHFQEIQKKMEELNKTRDSMAKEQAQLDSERQAHIANDPYFSRGRFEAESILKLVGQTMDQIKKERQLLLKQQLEIEQSRHFLREREASIEKRDEEVEECKAKAKKILNNAYELQKKATQEIKDYSILKEQMVIYGDRITAERKLLHLEFQKLLDDRLELTKEKHEFEKLKGHCWWCRLVTLEKGKQPKANESDILAQLGLGSFRQIGSLASLPNLVLPSDKPKPFNFNVNPQANNVSLSVATAPVASTPATLPNSSTDSDLVDNFLDREVRTARKRAHKRARR